jgi:predicted amidophosphoribosyltransferase
MRQVKENRVVSSDQSSEPMASHVARRLAVHAPPFIATFLGPKAVLVPVPRSGLPQRGMLWPALELARALLARGFGASIVDCLRRVHPVPKAAIAAPRDRPRAQTHCDSLSVSDPMTIPAEVTLVDDVITRGAQMMGAAQAIWAVRADVIVRGFAVIRTISRPEDFKSIASPCSGQIDVRRSGDCFRSP